MTEMEINPYESPKVDCSPSPRATVARETDWFALCGLFIGTLVAMGVGLRIGNSSPAKLLLGITLTLVAISMSGWGIGQLQRRNV
jgi:hypothetical protein